MQLLWDKYSCIPGRGVCAFDPLTLTGLSLATTAVAGATSAAGTIAGGNAAAQAGQMKQQADQYAADQLRENAGSEIGAAQRKMLDTQLRTKLTNSSVEARAAGGGVNAAEGSPLATEKANAGTGAYHSLMDLFEGQNRATGSINQAQGLEYSGKMERIGGEMARNASYLTAAGTVAGAGSSMLKTYGAYRYPNLYGRTGVG